MNKKKSRRRLAFVPYAYAYYLLVPLSITGKTDWFSGAYLLDIQ